MRSLGTSAVVAVCLSMCDVRFITIFLAEIGLLKSPSKTPSPERKPTPTLLPPVRGSTVLLDTPTAWALPSPMRSSSRERSGEPQAQHSAAP
jgi:hypothetical protein